MSESLLSCISYVVLPSALLSASPGSVGTLSHPVAEAMPNRALIVVDVLNDFMPGYEGPMQARGDAPTLLDGLNTLLKSDFFSVRLAIGDHHPPVGMCILYIEPP